MAQGGATAAMMKLEGADPQKTKLLVYRDPDLRLRQIRSCDAEAKPAGHVSRPAVVLSVAAHADDEGTELHHARCDNREGCGVQTSGAGDERERRGSAALMRSRLVGDQDAGRGAVRSNGVRRGACSDAGCISLTLQPKNAATLPDCCHRNRGLSSPDLGRRVESESCEYPRTSSSSLPHS